MPRGNFGRPLIGRPVVWSRVSKCPWAMYWIPNWLLAIGVSVPECKTLKSLCGSERCYKSPLMWLSGTCNWSPDRTISISVENGSRTKMGLLSMWTEWQQIPGVSSSMGCVNAIMFIKAHPCHHFYIIGSLLYVLNTWPRGTTDRHGAARRRISLATIQDRTQKQDGSVVPKAGGLLFGLVKLCWSETGELCGRTDRRVMEGLLAISWQKTLTAVADFSL